ncbi:N-acetylglucosamine 6-phosphate deacetylase [Oceanobacillus limi]|uniref:N-acetylglucosamine-6-phosphate deacetylase n=1 Tax=Oceanobacillus limi TaxID=930131 RepID=A0A1I0BQL0_9BACI|nr:N-acetylglucosamine-6-phosphate deacetylase [Oceanobacillus limi]SET09180.1 N-acetylglucosamine 6-phosphate deacetylase [Oceanobacillus limi]
MESGSNSIYIRNVTIYTENEIISNGSVLVEDGKINAIFSENEKPTSYPNRFKILDGSNLNLIPGFIDGHIHGANGADVMDATEKAMDAMASVLPMEGTTSFLATTITQSPENIEKALQNIAKYPNKPGQAEVLGVHLEGPFIEASKKGAQPLEYIMKPDIAQFDKWQKLSGNKIKTITMAPEHDEDGSFIRHLFESGVNVSAGHTATGFEGMKKAVSHGVRQITHLCNAMNGIHHRDIGVVGAAFSLEELRAELIADGIHVVPDMLELIYRNVGSERLILITDAMRAKCLQAGDYELGGQPVTVTEDRAVLEDGTLAGSILKLQHGAQRMLMIKDVSLQQVIEMASINPAKQLNIFDKKGSIAVGKDADLLLVDDELNLSYTICQGVIAFEEENINENY